MNMKRNFARLLTVSALLTVMHAARAANHTVTMANFSFSPSPLKIAVGDTVTWTNTAANSHTTSSSADTTCTTDGRWDSLNVLSHTTFSITFTNFPTGTNNYVCTIHCALQSMKGILIITNAPNTPPAVTITNPIAGAVFAAPANVTIGADASDTGGSVTNVQFRVNSTVLLNDAAAPYSAVTNNMPSGSYSLIAIASDNLGATATNTVSITVDSAPSVSITNPVAGAVLTAPTNVTIQASASDDGSVSSVLFLVDANTLATDNSSPYSALTNNLSPGAHTLTAIATDNLGLKSTNAISIIVNALPFISITNPLTGAAFLAPTQVVLKAAASDTDGSITNVQFFSGAVSLGNITTAPFNFTNNNLAAGNYTFTAKAQDNFGGATTSAAVNIFLLTNSTLLSPVFQTNGLMVFTLSGIAGQTYITEGSTNLFDWIPIATNLAPASLFNITNSSATNFQQRFFRSRQDY